MPGILISHSHHNPKTQGELQDMGMTWARSGCLVLVMDHLGHGERQHPFRTEADYPHLPGRPAGLLFPPQHRRAVHLVGESLMGWMAWDLMRGLDLLLSRPGIDEDRVILLGAVAGGDPAAVTAALDPRVKAVVPFNFGGPQPDYAVPDDPARDFYWFGVPSGVDPVPAAGGAGRVRPVADRRVRGPPAADLRPRVRLGRGATRRPRPGGLRLVRRPRPPGGRRGPRQPEGDAAGELPLQQHRPAPPQQDLPDPGAGSACRSPRSTACGGRRMSCCA